MLSIAVAGTAVAAPVAGKDGKVHACYRVKGKAKGAMRVVPAGKKCKRGERKLAWSVAGPPGPSGASGASGQTGQPGSKGDQGTQGQPGSNGTPGTGVVALETEVADLTIKIASLENVLDGLDNAKLTEVVDDLPLVKSGLAGLLPKVTSLETELQPIVSSLPALKSTVDGLSTTVPGLSSNLTGLTSNVKGVEDVLKGVDNTGLTAAVKAVPAVAEVCQQAKTLTTQTNLLRTGVGNLVTTLTGTLLGAIFGGVSLPPALDPFTCTGV